MCYVLYFVCVCYAMGHAAWNKSYDDDDDDDDDDDKQTDRQTAAKE